MQTPRLEVFGPHRLVGLMRLQGTCVDPENTSRGLPAQWTEFVMRLAKPRLPSQCLGIHESMLDGETHFRYFTGTYSTDPVPEGFCEYIVPQGTYAVFAYDGHVSGLRVFVHSAFVTGIPSAGLSLLPKADGAPEFMERYLPSFDPVTTRGGIEIMIPVCI